MRFCIVDELENAGAEVIEAVDGLRALKLIEAGLPLDALVTDVRMPRMDGWTLAERVRELHPHLPVIYVTGWSEAPRPVPGGRVIAKPFGSHVVPIAVASLMRGADAQDINWRLYSRLRRGNCKTSSRRMRRVSSDIDYYRRRADEELELAQRATVLAVATAH